MRILGIDPGSRICGWGIIEETKTARNIAFIDCGIVAPSPKLSLPERLGRIYDGLTEVIRIHKPDQVGVEGVFFAKNVKSAIVLGQARGVALLAARNANIEVFEYAPTSIKQAVCGYGRAEKAQVARMVMAILQLPEVAQTDASDALACAICHCNSYRLAATLKGR